LETLERNGIAIEGVGSVSIRSEMDSPRVDQLIVEHAGGVEAIKATDLRSMFGFARIKSTWFDAKLARGSVVFDGRGYGHGVGMCQWGAKGMADQGASYEQILKFYYADAQIMKSY
jgi:stage II sporulation protein D